MILHRYLIIFAGLCACSAEPVTEDPSDPIAPNTVALPSALRVARSPVPPDFGCPTPAAGLVVERLAAAGRTATVAGQPVRFELAALKRLRRSPLTAACEARGVAERLSAEAGAADAIRAGAAWLAAAAHYEDRWPQMSLADAMAVLCEGETCDAAPALPEALDRTVAAVVVRLRAAIDAEAAVRAQMGTRSAADWVVHGGDGLLAAPLAGFDITYAPDSTYLETSRVDVYEAAAAVAQTVESVDWSAFVGLRDVAARVHTPWGPIVLADGGADVHDFVEAPLLLVDLGGDDVYRGRSGSTSVDRPVAVVVDLAGADVHGPAMLTATSTTQDLPADADGRATVDRFVDATMSTSSAQGGARTGAALWFDLGEDDDVYVALRASQGYAHHGVGLLYDGGGSDLYRVEAAGQGAAQFGIGVLVDRGRGDDIYLAEHTAQGHGYTSGIGVLLDDGGNDRYRCAPEGGRYPAPQREGLQASLCQGAGFGYRDPRPDRAQAGGLGVLVDLGGDDAYTAGVYAQGVGYAEGVGVLVDQRGHDAYDARWHGQGAGVHGGAGLLVDAGVASDRYGLDAEGLNVLMGAGHDRGLGLLYDQGGADTYQLAPSAVGAATCGSLGLFVDEAGDDVYQGSTPAAMGHANPAGCAVPGLGVMVDAGGVDRYPAAHRQDSEWDDGAGGLGVDGEGSSGLAGFDNPR